MNPPLPGALEGAAIFVRRASLIDEGFSDREIGRSVRGGGLVRLRPGYFTPSGRSPARSDEMHRLRVIAAADAASRLVVSHVSAAVLHGLWLHAVDLSTVHLTRPGHGGGRSRPGQKVHSGRLLPSDIVTVQGCETTSVPRTVVDLARELPFASAVVAIDAALRRSIDAAAEIADCLAATKTLRGHRAARLAIAAADGRSESVGETLTRLMLVKHALPDPELQPDVYDESGRFVARPDLAYLGYGVLIEFDGKIKYQRGVIGDADITEVVLQEKRREEALSELGWLVVRVGWSDLADPVALISRISRAMAARLRLVEAGGIRGSVRRRPARRVSLP